MTSFLLICGSLCNSSRSSLDRDPLKHTFLKRILVFLPLVNRFHKGEVTPVVTDVSRFMETLLNDCSREILDGDSDFPPEEQSFLVLKVLIDCQSQTL